jgi:hypothetical protein
MVPGISLLERGGVIRGSTSNFLQLTFTKDPSQIPYGVCQLPRWRKGESPLLAKEGFGREPFDKLRTG